MITPEQFRAEVQGYTGDPPSESRIRMLARYVQVSVPTVKRWATGQNHPHPLMFKSVLRDIRRLKREEGSMLERIVERIAAWCERKGKVFRITGTGGPSDVYLVRYYVLKSRWLNIFIHRFMRSDRDDMHDHPWDFATYLVRGAYTENKWNPSNGTVVVTRRANQVEYAKLREFFNLSPTRHQENRLVFRRATDQHQVLTDDSYPDTPDGRSRAPLTVCVTGPTRREWGFVKEEYELLGEFTPEEAWQQTGLVVPEGKVARYYRSKGRRWTQWREYLGLPPETPGRG